VGRGYHWLRKLGFVRADLLHLFLWREDQEAQQACEDFLSSRLLWWYRKAYER
jgi:hypothetical protein